MAPTAPTRCRRAPTPAPTRTGGAAAAGDEAATRCSPSAPPSATPERGYPPELVAYLAGEGPEPDPGELARIERRQTQGRQRLDRLLAEHPIGPRPPASDDNALKRRAVAEALEKIAADPGKYGPLRGRYRGLLSAPQCVAMPGPPGAAEPPEPPPPHEAPDPEPPPDPSCTGEPPKPPASDAPPTAGHDDTPDPEDNPVRRAREALKRARASLGAPPPRPKPPPRGPKPPPQPPGRSRPPAPITPPDDTGPPDLQTARAALDAAFKTAVEGLQAAYRAGVEALDAAATARGSPTQPSADPAVLEDHPGPGDADPENGT